jgi:hypothetical protein
LSTTRADFYWNFKRLVSALNGGTASSFTAVLDDPRRSYGEIFASLQAADDEICTAIGETEGQGFRPLFLSDSSDLQHGDTLPDRLGPMAQVKIKYKSGDSDYKAGKFDKDLSLADIERWRANAGSIYGEAHDTANSSLSGFYLELGDEIYFTGYRAKGKIATYTRYAREQALDGSMLVGAKALTSAGALFLSTDVGAGVMVDGAGASGVPLVSRIDSFTSTALVTLRDANASGSGVSSKTITVAKLQCPQNYEDALLAIGVTNQIKNGDNPPFANIYLQAASNYIQMIRSGKTTIPSLEIAQAA